MSDVLAQFLAANAEYAESFGEKAHLPMPPMRRAAILTCMDARMDPNKFLGLREGDAHIIRNAGGRASDDAIRSLVISHKLQGTSDWFVIHHTDCGMEAITSDLMGDLLAQSLETVVRTAEGFQDVGAGDGSEEGRYINWLTIHDSVGSVVDDVRRIRNHPLVNGAITIYGYIFDVHTGKLIEVPEATAAGRAKA